MAQHSIKARAKMSTGDVADIKILIMHPMDTGLIKNAKTGEVIPAHFIKQLTVTLNGKTVLDADLGIAISKNPFFDFRVKGAKAGDALVINWLDNLGDSDTLQTSVS
ncbi:MAG: thiosulfate oxidation carrier complex protein SoxZ [Betaproteobacteria bacterium]|nr:thiosulfate oxidation carrier complex protein SoxZ [Betaproteobacteria bacterium]